MCTRNWGIADAREAGNSRVKNAEGKVQNKITLLLVASDGD